MAEKVEVTDVSKLRPDLLSKSYNELERMKAEIEMAMNSKKAEEEARVRGLVLDEASDRIDRVIDDLKWLFEKSFLSEAVVTLFTSNVRAKGKKGGKEVVTNETAFLPHLRFKKPTK